MNNARTYDQVLHGAKQVDTCSDPGGYPRGLRVAYTADTMAELRELQEAAEAEGHDVTPIMLHRCDGWSLWHRMSNDHYLGDDRWMGAGEQDWTISINSDCDREQEAFDAICGYRYELEDVEDLMAKARAVQKLAEDLADPDSLEDGEMVIHFLDSNNSWVVNYSVRSGQNGYSYDTHQYCTALLIEEREEEEEDEDDQDAAQ